MVLLRHRGWFFRWYVRTIEDIGWTSPNGEYYSSVALSFTTRKDEAKPLSTDQVDKVKKSWGCYKWEEVPMDGRL